MDQEKIEVLLAVAKAAYVCNEHADQQNGVVILPEKLYLQLQDALHDFEDVLPEEATLLAGERHE